MQVQAREIFLDQIALVARADDELGNPMGGIDVHDVPEHGMAADLDQRLRPRCGLFFETAAATSCQNDRLHAPVTLPCTPLRLPASVEGAPRIIIHTIISPMTWKHTFAKWLQIP